MARYKQKLIRTTKFYSPNMVVRINGNEDEDDTFILKNVDLENNTYELERLDPPGVYLWKEPICKIVDLEYNKVFETLIGDCDDCDVEFHDYLTYYRDTDDPGDTTMLCNYCWEKRLKAIEESRSPRNAIFEGQRDEDIHPTIHCLLKNFQSARLALNEMPIGLRKSITDLLNRIEDDVLFHVVPEKKENLLS